MKKFLYSLILLIPMLFIGCADAGNNQEVYSSSTVILDGSATTTEANGKIVKYKWKQLRGKKVQLTNKNSVQASFTAPTVSKETRLVFRLTTYEKSSRLPMPYLKTKDTVTITVKPELAPNIPPQAVIQTDATTIKEGESILFDASGSTDEDGEIVSYKWLDAENNILSQAISFTHSFASKGEYKITLIVEDDSGLTNTQEITINVLAILTSINISIDNTDIETGQSAKLLAMGIYSDGISKNITNEISWIVSDNTKLTIDEFGTVNTIKSGVVTIKTTFENIESNTLTVNIYDPIVLQSIKVFPSPIVLRVDDIKDFSITGTYSDGSQKSVTNNITYQISDLNLAKINDENKLLGLAIGTTTLKIIVGSIQSELIPITVNKKIDTTNLDDSSFGTNYAGLIPADATKTSYDEKLFGMITGKISNESGNALSQVSVSIANQPQYGTTYTQEDGTYVIPVEGNQSFTVRYSKDGYTSIDRKVLVPMQDWAIAPDVTMLTLDSKVTTISLNTATPQIHASTLISDERGLRATTLVFDNITSAIVRHKDGTTRTLETLNVRATEFKQPQSMPSDLPSESAYTYCSDLTVDGVSDDESIEFNAPVIMYVDNFLEFDVGEIVPIGYYDRNEGVWKGSKNGYVITFLDTNNDNVIDALDSTGDGQPNDLNGDGSFSDEVAGIANNDTYKVGNSYWRAEITHFTPWDHNWPYGPPSDATSSSDFSPSSSSASTGSSNGSSGSSSSGSSNGSSSGNGSSNNGFNNSDESCNDNSKKDQTKKCGDINISSYVDPFDQVFHEDIAIAGTPFTLHYSSKRVNGYQYTIDVNNIAVPSVSTTAVIIKLEVAGKRFEKRLAPNEFTNNVSFDWDGFDKLGKRVHGKIKANVTLQYEYDAFYYKASTDFDQAWAKLGSETTSIKARDKVLLSNLKTIELHLEAVANTNNAIANGWTLSNQNHAYDKFIQAGDGTMVSGNSGINVISKLIDTTFTKINDIQTDIHGNIYIATGGSGSSGQQIKKIDTNGTVTTIAGNRRGFSGDGGLATQARLYSPTALSFDSKGNMYVSDYYNNRIRKIDTAGIISTVAGNGVKGFAGDGGLATQASLSYPKGLAIDSQDNVYFVADYRVRKIDSDGIITTITGSGVTKNSGDNGLAVDASIMDPHGLAIDSQDNIYIGTARSVRKIDKNGIITTIAGNGNYSSTGDGGLAKDASVRKIFDIEVDNFGNIYLASGYSYRVRKIDRNGIITTVAGNGVNTNSGDEQDATTSSLRWPYGVALNRYNTLFIASYDKVRKVNFTELYQEYDLELNQKTYANANNTIDVYDFFGKHLKTVDSTTNTVLKSYAYDTGNRLLSVMDQFGNKISIQRDANGNPTQITAPNGQTTSLDIDENGDLLNITYEDSTKFSFTYDENALLQNMTNQNSNTVYLEYDAIGHLTKDTDNSGAIWSFEKSLFENYTDYIVNKPENNSITYRKYIKDALGIEKEETILPSNDVIYKEYAKNRMKETITADSVIAVNNYKLDEKSKRKILSSSTITQPSGLLNQTSYATTYKSSGDTILSKTRTITSNAKTITIKNDYANGVDTLTTPQGRVASSQYNLNTKLVSKITAGTLTPTTYTYDSLGRIIGQTTGSKVITYTYDIKGNISSITNARGKTTQYEYDILAQVTKIIHPNGAIEAFVYDSNGNITKRVTPTPTNHIFTYDKLDQRASYNSPLNKQTSYTYNQNRELTQILRPSGNTISNTYVKNRLTATTTPEATINYEYLFANKIGTITKADEKLTFAYDGDLLTSLTQTGLLNQTIAYAYDSDFEVTSSTYAGSSENYDYDKDGLMTSSGAYTFTRDAQNAYVTQVSDGTLIQNSSYDSYGELTKVSDNTFTYEITSKDNASLILQKQETINSITSTYDYVYDDNSRLIEVKKDNVIVESYSYDDNGNRLSATVNGVTTSASYTLDDQLEVYGNNTYRYDDDGYLSEKITPEGVTTYAYSTVGELKEVVTPTKNITYAHNASNQRVAKLINGVIVEKYLWANLTTLLATYDKDDNLVQRFEYANSRMPITMTYNASKYYLHYNQVGSLRAVSDNTNTIIKEITYDSFGNIVGDSNPSFKVPFGFAGGLYDEDTGLTRFGYRDYDSFTGKWTAKDPIDFSGGDSNLYGYVLGNPVNFVDPDGLNPVAARIIVILETISKSLKKLKNFKFDGSKLDFRGVGSVCQVRYKKQPIFRIDYTVYPGTKGKIKLHYHIGDMKKHRPFPNWVNSIFKKFNK